MGHFLDEMLSQIQGLEPKASLVLGSGFVREEWKTLCFKKGYSITGAAIQNVRQLAATLVPESGSRLLGREARVELLRQAFKQEELRTALPLLSRYRMRPHFFEKLDQTLQQGRMNFAHQAEAEVISQQLTDRTGNLKKREEFFLLNRYWERLLELRELWDEARLYESAVQALPSTTSLLPLYYRVEHSREKPRVEWFWSELLKKTEIRKIQSQEFLKEPLHRLTRKRAHSLEDAANFLLDEVSKDLEQQVVVIQDSPVIRRTLKRVAAQRGISFLDSRDPTLVTQSEAMKQALLDLELCAKGFSRAAVLEWLRYFHPKAREFRKKIIESAIVQGLHSYERIPELHFELKRLNERHPSRLTLSQLKTQLLESIREHDLPLWTRQVMERMFEAWETSLLQVEQHRMKKPLRYWLEQIQEQLKQVNPVVDPIKSRVGLRLYRVDQCPSLLLGEQTKVHFFGIENSYFESKDVQGEWFSIRDQEVLASEFGWLSSLEKSNQNRHSFELWNAHENSIFWEFEYDENGQETEGFDFALGDAEKFTLEKIGAHPRLLSSWKGAQAVPMDVETLKLPEKEAWPFSFAHAYGNCPFVAYAQHLLKLNDERDVEVELSADRLGTLLHAALEEVVKDPSDLERAFEMAWKNTPAIAWEKNERWYQATRHHVLSILRRFIEDESAYRERSQTNVLESEKEVEVKFQGLPFRGRIDRIDEHEDGLVVMDYKTGGGHSDGHTTLETGKDLQLGLYALAVREVFQKEVITAQYIHLAEEKINRNSGFLFGAWNKGKKADEVARPISTARSNSHSLFTEEPSTVWAHLQTKVNEIAQSIQAGKFSPKPADPMDCARCRFEGICGESRR